MFAYYKDTGLKPYRFSFISDGRRHSWIRFYRDMETALQDSKKVAIRENSDAHGFMIESDQDSREIRATWGLDF